MLGTDYHHTLIFGFVIFCRKFFLRQ